VSNDEQAEFTGFFEDNWAPCLRAVIAVTGDPQLAEDQVAEAFARAWRSWRKVSRHPAPQAWVVRAALNAGASWWRRGRREQPLADHDPPTPPPPAATGLEATLLSALRQLPARQREVIALRIFLDLDTDTIARQLGIGTGREHGHGPGPGPAASAGRGGNGRDSGNRRVGGHLAGADRGFGRWRYS
jgi:RNA polymerase sigma-70 factor (ECF subfamily)